MTSKLKKAQKQIQEDTKQPHAIKNCGLFKIYPHIGHDTLNGKPIRNSVMFMTITGGEGSTVYKGKKIGFEFNADLGGCTIIYCNGRMARINLREFITAALDAGLADDKIDFTETEA